MPIHLSANIATQLELVAITDEARAALGGVYVPCRSFPFRVGRERRRGLVRTWHTLERRLGVEDPVNDVYLVPQPPEGVEHICARHFQIEATDEGFLLVDRGSRYGTWVNHRAVGGGEVGGREPLHDGDAIKLGTAGSPYRFRFLIGATDLATDEWPGVLRQPAGPEAPGHALTAREHQVLTLLADGLPSLRIAGRLSISPNTVRNHVQHILDKLGVHTRLAAVTLAHRHGLVSLDASVDDGRGASWAAGESGTD